MLLDRADVLGHRLSWVSDDGVVRAAVLDADDAALLARLGPGVEAQRGTDEPTRAAVAAWLAGDHAAPTRVPVAQAGTPYQAEVWAALREIQAGAPITYSQLASRTGRPAAVRAAAGGCARNRVAFFVPCHRVVRSDGALGGYAWGLEVKQALLAHEAR